MDRAGIDSSFAGFSLPRLSAPLCGVEPESRWTVILHPQLCVDVSKLALWESARGGKPSMNPKLPALVKSGLACDLMTNHHE